MIPKGLNVGDTFKMGMFTYKVTGLDGENYQSIRVGETSPDVAEAEKPDYLSMQYAQLKKLCAERGLDATGKKDDLIARLEG